MRQVKHNGFSKTLLLAIPLFLGLLLLVKLATVYALSHDPPAAPVAQTATPQVPAPLEAAIDALAEANVTQSAATYQAGVEKAVQIPFDVIEAACTKGYAEKYKAITTHLSKTSFDKGKIYLRNLYLGLKYLDKGDIKGAQGKIDVMYNYYVKNDKPKS